MEFSLDGMESWISGTIPSRELSRGRMLMHASKCGPAAFHVALEFSLLCWLSVARARDCTLLWFLFSGTTFKKLCFMKYILFYSQGYNNGESINPRV